jgi:hypothetical protein
MSDRVEPFVISVQQAALDDLPDRLRRTRWPERETVGDWSQGDPGAVPLIMTHGCRPDLGTAAVLRDMAGYPTALPAAGQRAGLARGVWPGRGLGHGVEVDSEVTLVGGEQSLVVWQVLLGALSSRGADQTVPADRDPAVPGEP